MAQTFEFPKRTIDREQVITRAITNGKNERSTQSANWWLAYHYLQGAREFRTINYTEGTVEVDYVADTEKAHLLAMKYEGITKNYQAQLGRLMKVDLRPSVSPLGVGLDGFRNASVAQVALDHAITQNTQELLRFGLWPYLLLYGTVGLVVWNRGGTIGIDAVPPWEILPLPSGMLGPDVPGVIRRRMVPLESVQQLPVAPSAQSNIWDQMEKVKVPRGTFNVNQNAINLGSGADPDQEVENRLGVGSKVRAGRSDPQSQETEVVELAEVWVTGEDGYMSQYQVCAGGRELHYQDFRDDPLVGKVYTPISVARYTTTGNFWGRSYVEQMIPMNAELEYMAQGLFQNVEDLDLFGFMLMPTTSGAHRSAEVGQDGIKRLAYEPEYGYKEFRPEQITPANVGTLPIEAVRLAKGLLDDVAGLPEMLSGEAPGRVDSAAGLGTLAEYGNIPLTPAATSVVQAVTHAYRSILNHARLNWNDSRIISVMKLDDSLAGVSLDPATGNMKLSENTIPHPDEVKIDVISEVPKSRMQIKMELDEALGAQLITPFEYRVQARKNSLDIPLGNETEWQNYRRAMMENIMMFGDGQRPPENAQQRYFIVSESDMHVVHLYVLDAFMARPEFYLASEAVREVFKQHRSLHESLLGSLPNQMPYPEESAQMRMDAEGLIQDVQAADMAQMPIE